MSAPTDSNCQAPCPAARQQSCCLHANDELQRRVLEDPDVDFPRLSRVCRRGLTDWARPMFWKVMMGFYPTCQALWPDIEANSERSYKDIVEGSCELDEHGDPIMDNSIGGSIDADVPRTMPTLNFFLPSDTTSGSSSNRRAQSFSESQRSLRRVMYTVAVVNKGFGYVQGMSHLAGQLLVAFCEGKREKLTRNVEADVFFCFQTILAYLGDDFCRTLDDNKDSGVISTIRHFDNVLQFLDLELYDHLLSLDICSEHYALRWLMLLFTREFNIADSLRIWDFLFSFGDQLRNCAMFVAAAMCVHIRGALLGKDCLSDAMPLLLDYPPCDTNDFLVPAMRWIARYDFGIIAQLKCATRGEVVQLRREHGLQAGDSIPAKMQQLVSSFFR